MKHNYTLEQYGNKMYWVGLFVGSITVTVAFWIGYLLKVNGVALL